MFGTLNLEPLSSHIDVDVFDRCRVVSAASNESPFFRFLMDLNCRDGIVVGSVEPVHSNSNEILSNLVSSLVERATIGKRVIELARCLQGRQQNESGLGH